MPVLHAAHVATHGAGTNTQPLRTPILITEHEVAFSTAAAGSLPSTGTTRGLDDIVALVRRMFLTASLPPRAARRHYPKHYSYLEGALLQREMDRL
jgi:hypothetical protein